MQRVGSEALKLVLALPWWYDAHDGRRYTLNTVLPVTKDQIAESLSGGVVSELLGDRVAPNGDFGLCDTVEGWLAGDRSGTATKNPRHNR